MKYPKYKLKAGTNLANLPWRGLTTLRGTASKVNNGIDNGIAKRHCHCAIAYGVLIDINSREIGRASCRERV